MSVFHGVLTAIGREDSVATVTEGGRHVADAAGRFLMFPPESSSEAFLHMMEGWHEFYLMTGTAAVTLTGLLFVSLSIHLDVLLHDRRAHLLDLARQTLLSFVYVLILSLMFLVPPSTPRLLALTVVASSIVFGGVAVWGLVKEVRTRETGLRRGSLFRRRMLQIVAILLVFYAGFLLWFGIGGGAFMMIGPLCMLLGNATGSAWDLLVQVGRLKANEEHARH